MTQTQALAILKTGVSVFLTGEPGSGKTHTVNEYVSYLRARGVEPAITASTGIAATHIGGMTVHSWSGIGIKTKLSAHDLQKIAASKYIAPRVARTRVLIIDEVSMLAPDTLAMVDLVCRAIKQSIEPFGGFQIVLVGDFFQLPPVVKNNAEVNGQPALLTASKRRFAYESSAWARVSPAVCYLTEQYRQDDPNFLAVLSAIRRNRFDDTHAGYIASRRTDRQRAPAQAPKLFSHNADVDRVNSNMLARLPGKAREFDMMAQGRRTLVDALKKGCLSPERLALKVGAAAMFTKNSPKEGFVNGTLGTVVGFDKGTGLPAVKIRHGRQIKVGFMDWTVEENGMARARISQLPLRLAWAITVHKSQGMSMDEAVMDLSQVFEFGQGYVALSRVRRLSGLHLLGWNERSFKVHPDILAQDESWRAQSREAEQVFSNIAADDLKTGYDNFIVRCGGTPNSADVRRTGEVRKKNKVSTLDITLALWNEGNNISDIASARALSPGTILGHIEALVDKGKMPRAELSRILTTALERSLPGIHIVFQELETKKLAPVFEKFNGAYSYDELRIARMLL